MIITRSCSLATHVTSCQFYDRLGTTEDKAREPDYVKRPTVVVRRRDCSNRSAALAVLQHVEDVDGLGEQWRTVVHIVDDQSETAERRQRWAAAVTH